MQYTVNFSRDDEMTVKILILKILFLAVAETIKPYVGWSYYRVRSLLNANSIPPSKAFLLSLIAV